MRTPLLVVAAGVLIAMTPTGGSVAAPAAPGVDTATKGRIKICVTGGGPLSVFADGPDLRTATLRNRCQDFRVRSGQYYVGVQGNAVPDNCSIEGATVRRGSHRYRAPEVLFTHVEPGRTTQVAFALDCSLPNR